MVDIRAPERQTGLERIYQCPRQHLPILRVLLCLRSPRIRLVPLELQHPR